MEYFLNKEGPMITFVAEGVYQRIVIPDAIKLRKLRTIYLTNVICDSKILIL